MEFLLPLLWWCDALSLSAALVVYAVHRLEMPEHAAATAVPRALSACAALVGESALSDYLRFARTCRTETSDK